MSFCIVGYLRIKSSTTNAIWFIKTNFLEAIKYFRLGIGAIVLFEIFTLARSQNWHFGALPGSPLTQFRVIVYFVSVENPWNKRNVWKGIPIFLVGKYQAKIRISCLQIFFECSFTFLRPIFVKRNWPRQMVNAITERNQNSSVLNSVQHLPKRWGDRFTHENSKKALCQKPAIQLLLIAICR